MEKTGVKCNLDVVSLGDGKYLRLSVVALPEDSHNALLAPRRIRFRNAGNAGGLARSGTLFWTK